MRKRKTILAEFAITVYTDGTIDWDRFDKFLWRLLHPKPKIIGTKGKPAQVAHQPKD